MTSPLQKDFEKLVRPLCHRHPLWRVFSDFCEMAALSLANSVEQRADREERYRAIVAAYEPAEVAVFPKLLGTTVLALEGMNCDFLGEAFMALELSSHWKGQYFTPIALCSAIGSALLDEGLEAIVKERGFVTVNEPACGAGALVIAFAAAMLARGLNPQRHLHVVANDVDPTAAHMCFVQLALLGIPAQVAIGDTLRLTCTDLFTTPMHHMGLWHGKLRRGYALGTPAAEVAGYGTVPPKAFAAEPATPPAAPARADVQLDLFAMRGAA